MPPKATGGDTPPTDRDGPDGPGTENRDTTPASTVPPPRRGVLDRILGRKNGGRPRPHPYAKEASTEAETQYDPRQVTLFWAGLATLMAVGGLLLQARFSPYGGTTPSAAWDQWTLIPLFSGLALLGFGFVRRTWSQRLTLTGWLLFAFYWALVAKDLFLKENADYVNFVFALLGVYFFTYLAYHQWLSLARGVHNDTLHFLNVTAFVAAGSYFLIAKVQFLRLWLIHVVSDHTNWMLGLFGQGKEKGLVFLVDKTDSQGPTTFFYPDKYCDAGRLDDVGRWCASHNVPDTITVMHPQTWWDHILMYTPDHDLKVIPVSIILACTAIQSIMLFVGLFAGTKAPLKRKVAASLIVGAIVYVLNLVRNTGIIWFYGQGHASFWMMHNAIGKGGSLVAMIAIAFGVFKWFPEFFHALVGVLDLPDRDGPIERTLRIGRRRPQAEGVPSADAGP